MGGSIGCMMTPSNDLETALSALRTQANDIDDSAGWALKAAAGSASRDRHCINALATLDDLEQSIVAVRNALGQLP